jgi:zinc protease
VSARIARRVAALLLVACGCLEHLPPLGPVAADRARLAGEPAGASAEPFPSAAPSATPPRPTRPPEIREARLHNGVRVLMLEAHKFPIAGVAYVLARGDADVDRPGLMDVFFRELTSSSDLVSSKGLHTDLYALGAQRNFNVYTSYSALEVTSVTPVMADATRIEASTFVSPAFESEEFDPVRAHHRPAARAARGAPAGAARRELMKLLYPAGHPYAQDAADSDKPLDGVKLRDVEAMRPLVGADDVAVAVAGNFDSAAFLADLEKALGGLGGHAAPVRAIPDVRPPDASHVLLLDHPGDLQVQIALGFATVKYDSPDYAALYLASRLLGRASWKSMRLSHGLTYGASASMPMSRLQAPFMLTVAAEPSRVGQALRDALASLEMLRSYDKNPDELAAAKQTVDASWPNSFDTIAESLETLERIAGFGLPPNAWTTLRDAVQAVTAADLARVADKYLAPTHLQVVLLGDVARFRTDVSSLGLGAIQERGAPH